MPNVPSRAARTIPPIERADRRHPRAVPGSAAQSLLAAADHPAGADEVLVRYRADTTKAQRARVASEHDLTVVRTSADGRTQVVVAEGRSPATARRQLKTTRESLAVGR